MQTNFSRPLLTPDDVGHWLAMTARNVKRLAREGVLPHISLPTGDIVFEPEEISRWVESRKVRSKEAAQ